ncbi:D-mannitol 1-phosphate 5-dehydrogenase [Marinococcus luteus]|uniref:Mannitol-1-phosphate 5-dehydrogenase n=1 Tax=Marinococcus luteus TaxID=1122204 RepID=A0A1H2QLC4_9BACI|nr:mannitol-1-phosphate 5-dehydrogenase [Marinococcus luteus]SDW07952.1 D-mannitol 1-phosphate 5-dehydrogenase [Marinococcus luteus]
MQALHFGAGNIGKGFIGKVLNDSGYKMCFVDVDEDNIKAINRYNEYIVEFLDETRSQIKVAPVEALNSRTQKHEVIEAVISADLITTSVGAANLSSIAGLLAQGLMERMSRRKNEIDVIANENAINASSTLRTEISKHVSQEQMNKLEDFVGFPNTAVDRLALSKEGDKTVPLVEPYYEWVINESEMKNKQALPISNAKYVKDLRYFIERKLFIVNMGHAATAYLGSAAQKSTIQQALESIEIKQCVREAMKESSQYIQNEFSIGEKEMELFIEETLGRFENPRVKDDVTRVGRNPIRKLGEHERLVKPLHEVLKLGGTIEHSAIVIAAAFMYSNPNDEEAVRLQKDVKTHGLTTTIVRYTNIKNKSALTKIEEAYQKLQNNDGVII